MVPALCGEPKQGFSGQRQALLWSNLSMTVASTVDQLCYANQGPDYTMSGFHTEAQLYEAVITWTILCAGWLDCPTCSGTQRSRAAGACALERLWISAGKQTCFGSQCGLPACVHHCSCQMLLASIRPMIPYAFCPSWLKKAADSVSSRHGVISSSSLPS